MMQQGTCSTTGRTPTGQNTYLTLVWSKKWDWTWKNLNPGSWWWSGWRNELEKSKSREFQQRISESQEVHGKMRTQLHLVDKEVWYLLLVARSPFCFLASVFLTLKCCFSKDLGDGLLDRPAGTVQEGQAGPAQGFFFLLLKNCCKRMFPIEVEAVESFFLSEF